MENLFKKLKKQFNSYGAFWTPKTRRNFIGMLTFILIMFFLPLLINAQDQYSEFHTKLNYDAKNNSIIIYDIKTITNVLIDTNMKLNIIHSEKSEEFLKKYCCFFDANKFKRDRKGEINRERTNYKNLKIYEKNIKLIYEIKENNLYLKTEEFTNSKINKIALVYFIFLCLIIIWQIVFFTVLYINFFILKSGLKWRFKDTFVILVYFLLIIIFVYFEDILILKITIWSFLIGLILRIILLLRKSRIYTIKN